MDQALKICTKDTSKPVVPLDTLVQKILFLGWAIAEKKPFAYQSEFGYRFVESVLLHSGEMLTGLMSRQSGKSETIAVCLTSMGIMLPSLSNMKIFEDDWRFNCTDEQGNYRGFKNGVWMGIYAPIQEQADIAFSRVRDILATDATKSVLKELRLNLDIANSNRLRMGNGSKLKSQSASEQSKIEGESFHILVLDEAQDIPLMKIRKGLHPMVAAYNGTIVKIGTPSVEKSDFYTSIKANKRIHTQGGPKNHYEYNYLVCQKYNSMYRDYIEKEKFRLSEFSDEFQLSYCCVWLLERGQFITERQLLHPDVAKITGGYHNVWTRSPRHSTQVAGIDFGKVHDPTVVTVVDVDWANPLADEWVDTPETSIHFAAYQKHIIAWTMFLGDNYESQFDQITEFLAPFKGLRKICLDATGVGQWGLDKFTIHYDKFDRGLDKQGLPDFGVVEVEGFNFTPTSKSEMYKLLHSDILSGRLTFPAGEAIRKDRLFRRFVGEFLDLRKNYKNGVMQCQAPDEPGAHDDFPVSCALANWSAQHPAFTGVGASENNLFFAKGA